MPKPTFKHRIVASSKNFSKLFSFNKNSQKRSINKESAKIKSQSHSLDLSKSDFSVDVSYSDSLVARGIVVPSDPISSVIENGQEKDKDSKQAPPLALERTAIPIRYNPILNPEEVLNEINDQYDDEEFPEYEVMPRPGTQDIPRVCDAGKGYCCSCHNDDLKSYSTQSNTHFIPCKYHATSEINPDQFLNSPLKVPVKVAPTAHTQCPTYVCSSAYGTSTSSGRDQQPHSSYESYPTTTNTANRPIVAEGYNVLDLDTPTEVVTDVPTCLEEQATTSYDFNNLGSLSPQSPSYGEYYTDKVEGIYDNYGVPNSWSYIANENAEGTYYTHDTLVPEENYQSYQIDTFTNEETLVGDMIRAAENDEWNLANSNYDFVQWPPESEGLDNQTPYILAQGVPNVAYPESGECDNFVQLPDDPMDDGDIDRI